MAKKIAVVCANGCEEIEALTPVDVLRRLGQEVDIVGLSGQEITGSHQIKFKADRLLDASLLDYDMVVLPGGLPGADYLRDSELLGDLLNQRHQAGKWNAAMCAGPKALAKNGLLDDTDYTAYPEIDQEVANQVKEARFHDDQLVIVDQKQKVITSRGPATALAYAYQIAQVLGIETQSLEEGMLYTFLQAHIND
ncbi:DJ-1 family glyoxalase III [Ligilactobacillus equi]|uniref:4-methyl-5(B-hydroxyethyl)-thiazole monophosphatebiosynthesis n=1 Tax=Ligilactobacillus equi DPC 6820 TaxID=1392007 RepID=V7HU69_9LACO|nr:DJ-1 family glyoxalase III [Ligilactobacillus equi]ETA73437.1 4-methyl-5(b-hydroxyethyl)-thiazole monophosphatebiosynthesis [Ligilactobacillus equi DPC 6820]